MGNPSDYINTLELYKFLKTNSKKYYSASSETTYTFYVSASLQIKNAMKDFIRLQMIPHFSNNFKLLEKY